MKIEQENIKTGQYLTFSLREEVFAVEIGKVREVLDVAVMTKIPRMPEFLRGVINLRGNVVPVMDLGQKLGMTPIKETINSSIVIVQLMTENDTVLMGAMTDAVRMVVDLHLEDIHEVPQMGANLNTEFIKGMGRLEEKFLIIS